MATASGTRRLSPGFVEWMMGLPAGWVTGTEGLSRATQLRLLGNSVVPAQTEEAIRLLLSHRATTHLSAPQPPGSCQGGE